MKFNCGPSPEEKYAKKEKELLELAKIAGDWHESFAWFPVRVAPNDCRWMEPILKKYTYAGVFCRSGIFGDYPELYLSSPQYRAKEST